MAQVCPGMTRRQLVWTTTWHLRKETFAVALDRLVELQQKTPLTEVFGGGTMSSSDGQNFYLGRPGEAVSSVNTRYGRDPAIKLYTHLSDRYAPLHVKVIAATGRQQVGRSDLRSNGGQQTAQAPARRRRCSTACFTLA